MDNIYTDTVIKIFLKTIYFVKELLLVSKLILSIFYGLVNNGKRISKNVILKIL